MANKKQCDYVLVVENDQNKENEKRKKFEKYLEDKGLTLIPENIKDIRFIKISIKNEVTDKFAEILKIHVPLKDCPVITAEFSLRKKALFAAHPWQNEQTTRILIISYILDGLFMHDKMKKCEGIKKLISDGVYKAAFPLHDGSYENTISKRGQLYDIWASLSKWKSCQPIDEIKDYFGPKVAMYFLWLGYYNTMLIGASIIGLISLIYGASTIELDILVNEICNSNVTMCPLCKTCPFWNLNDTCNYSKITYLVDNPISILNSVFMCVWATLCIETWERYRSELIYRWGLKDFSGEDEPDRPEYKKRDKPDKKEKYMQIFINYTVIIFWLLLTLAAIFAIIIYRMAVITTQLIGSCKNNIFITELSADILNLIAITILNYYYNKLAVWLTNKENLRTAAEYENSLTLKSCLFKFINYYSAVFYTAYMKGKFVGYPAKYNRIFGYRQEECQPGGCLLELSKQLAVIMIGEKIIDLIIENVEIRRIPIQTYIKNYFPCISVKNKANVTEPQNLNGEKHQCYEDYKLHQPDWDILFNEYIGMIVQYGFMSLFIIAFPIAPLLALINNTIELRLDAKKFVKYYRRTIPQRTKDIGIWIKILKLISNLAIASNAFIIAFSSNYVPKFFYATNFNLERDNAGYLEFALAHFNVSDFQDNMQLYSNSSNTSNCRYPEFRNPPNHEYKYKRPIHYWHILSYRLAFIIIYHNFICILSAFIKFCFPSTPLSLKKQIKKDYRNRLNIMMNNVTNSSSDDETLSAIILK